MSCYGRYECTVLTSRCVTGGPLRRILNRWSSFVAEAYETVEEVMKENDNRMPPNANIPKKSFN
jgi:hypothetical protein